MTTCLRRRGRLPTILATGLALAAMTAAAAPNSTPVVERARTVLMSALAEEQGFVKVHAAEALIALGHTEEPRRVFTAELPGASEIRPYRIGVWRVLAAASASREERTRWIAKLEAVVLEESAMDRLHAVETLAKLGHAPDGRVRAAIVDMAEGHDAAGLFPRWVLHLTGDRTALPRIVAALASGDPVARSRAAYVLLWLKDTNPGTRSALDRAVEQESRSAVGYVTLLCAAIALNVNPARTPARIAGLEHILAHGTASARYLAAQTLMPHYTPADFPKLTPLLNHPEGDARIGAAWAILHISSPRP